MPIDVPIMLPRLTHEEMRDIDYQVMAHAFAAHTELGRLCDEDVYKGDLTARLNAAGLGPVRQELPVVVSYRDFAKPYRLDLVVADRVIYEAKAVSVLTSEHTAQLLNYLLLTNSTRGKLINFRPQSVKSEFVNTALTHNRRQQFDLNQQRWRGDTSLVDLVCELLRDWGLFLEVSLYVEALDHFLGGKDKVIQQVPMTRDGIRIGNQRFHLASSDTAFRITAFTADLDHQEGSLRRLLCHSPLKAMHWINMNHHEVHFVTLLRQEV